MTPVESGFGGPVSPPTAGGGSGPSSSSAPPENPPEKKTHSGRRSNRAEESAQADGAADTQTQSVWLLSTKTVSKLPKTMDQCWSE